MKVLFVCSGNKSNGPVPVVGNQAKSLVDNGLHINFFLVRGKGIIGYLKNISALRNTILEKNYGVIHAHGISALLATLTLQKPLVVSLLGSELNESKIIRFIIRVFAWYYWSHTIVKSTDMLYKLKQALSSRVSVIPNGVDIFSLQPIDKGNLKDIGIQKKENEAVVLWLADPSRKSKNYQLALSAIQLIDDLDIRLVQVHNIPSEEVPHYINTSDILLLTSLWEGSPNIVKEAMACNCPVVATDVGDIRWLFGNEPGHYVTSFDPNDVAEKIKLALQFAKEKGRTNGRKRIIELGLDSETVAQKIINIYKSIAKSDE